MKKPILIALLFVSLSMTAQQVIEVPVWPNGASENSGITAPERKENGGIWNATTASFKVYLAPKEKNTGMAILICPGGAYEWLAGSHEGTQFAEWFAANGITGVVLTYRMPNGHSDIPSADVQEAMRIIRSKASGWGINPQKVGVAGFSAGGHLAATLLTHFDPSSRPDFGLLFYPVITMDETFTHAGSRTNLLGQGYNASLVEKYSNEKQIKTDTPPCLLLLSDDDKVVVPKNSIEFYRGLKDKNIPACMYIFPTGDHGWGFNTNFKYHEQMKAIMLDWLKQF